jgi:phosphoribosylanthranilate isomerase
MKIKVCGMRDSENINELLNLTPDYIGFIFYDKSKRFVADFPEVEIPLSIKIVGVFVNESIDEVVRIVSNYKLDGVQLHGDESVEYCSELNSKLSVEVIKAFAVDEDFDFNKTIDYESVCDLFLFDTKGKDYGGNGLKYDWSILKNYKGETPFLLSGGINENDVLVVKEFQHPKFVGVDLNSGFEDAPSQKNIEKLKEFKHKLMQSKFQADENGYYGQFGGAFIPELLYPNVKELEDNYLKIMESEEFQKEFKYLLKDYVGRPTPLYLAKRLSEKYGAHIYLKREDLNHTGAHKVNNTIGQILIAKHLGKKRIIAETGAGQHGVATATVCALMNLECVVFMGEIDIKRQAPNVARMKMLGAKVVPATSGSKTLKDATNEAIRDWIGNPEDTYYLIGSVVGPHPYPDMVARLQSVISKEIRVQLLEQTGQEKPDSVIACVGGGSNAAGAFYHFLDDEDVELIAVEAAGLGVNSGESAATSQLGEVGVLHGSKTILMQDEYGQVIEPYSLSAGLDYPGVGPLHAFLYESTRAKFMNATDQEALDAAYELTKIEGIIPALETAHALAVLPKLDFKKNQVVVVNLSGRGDKDLETYIKNLKA